MVQSYTAADCVDCPLALAAQKYIYTIGDIKTDLLAANSPERSIVFGSKIAFPFAVKDRKSRYQIRITYLSDSDDRIIKVLADQEVLQQGVKIPNGKLFTETYTVPSGVYHDGSFKLSLIALSGANVAITKLEVLSTGLQPLIYEDLLSDQLKSFTFQTPILSPIPMNVTGVKSPVMTLNGTWDFKYKTRQGKIKVPGEWEMQGFKVDPGQLANYVRTFVIPPDWSEKQIKLRFDGVSSYCKVFLNGKLLGDHEGGFVIFELDATNAVKIGKNKLEVQVASMTLSDRLGCVSQYAAHMVGGILRKVTLSALPKVNLAEVSPTVKFDQQFKNAELNIQFRVANASGTKANVRLNYMLLDRSGAMVSILHNHTKPITIGSNGVLVDNFKIQVNRPEKWDTEHPYLYTLVTRLMVNDKVVQENSQKLGFRQIDIRGNQFFVNNTPIKLHGANRHDIGALTGRSVSAEENLMDAIAFRNANCNYIRTSHYPPGEELLSACDSLGIFVEAEAAITWIEHGASPIWKEWNYLNTDFLPYFVKANLENIRGNRNHPSVIIWSLANESKWSPLWAKVNELVKKNDPTRPTSFHDQTWGDYNNANSMADIRNYHYPDMGGAVQANQFTDRPVLFGEYCHVQTYNRREEVTDPYIRTDWGRMLHQMYNNMYAAKGCLGGAIWAGLDDIFHMPDSTIVGYGPWGAILDAWRREKPEFISVKKSYAPFVISNLRSAKPHNGVLKLNIQNRYDFADLNEGTISYTANGTTKVLKMSLAPRTDGVLNLAIPDNTEEVMITYTDAKGFVCQEENLVFKINVPTVGELQKNTAFNLEKKQDKWVVSDGKKEFAFDIKTGILSGSELLKSIDLMVVPVNIDDGGATGVAGNNYQHNIEPLLYQPEAGWQTNAVSAQKEGSDVKVTVSGAYQSFSGQFIYSFLASGMVELEYQFRLVKNTTINPRQWGVVFTLPVDFQYLKYYRKGYWSTYPVGDIGRTKAEIKANPSALRYVEASLKAPSGSWATDANSLGSRDFRSTKANIYYAALSNDAGNFIEIISDGSQSARAWVDTGSVRFLIAELNGGGSDYFFETYYHAERSPLIQGTELKGKLKINVQ